MPRPSRTTRARTTSEPARTRGAALPAATQHSLASRRLRSEPARSSHPVGRAVRGNSDCSYDRRVHSYMLDGLVAASGRLDASRLKKDEGDSFIAISEVLIWVMALDERFAKVDGRYAASRRGDEFGRAIPGMRHAWNLLKHADLTGLVRLSDHGTAWPIQWPATWFELLWKPLEALPRMPERQRSPSQEAAYREHLAGHPVRLTLGGAIAFIHAEAGRLGLRPKPASSAPGKAAPEK